jgi:hypothetical protein
MMDQSRDDFDDVAANDNDDSDTLTARAAKAALAELRGDRAGILGAVGLASLSNASPQRRVPEVWSWIYVMRRLEEGFRTLRRVPMSTGPRGYTNTMPYYVYDRADQNAQLETCELERMAKLRNRSRLRPPPDAVTRMEEALWWPAKYLWDAERLARAVNLAAMWAATGTDIDEALRRIETTRREFNVRKLRGLCTITQGLIGNRVPIK